jgi:cell division protein FtsL
LKGPVGSPVVHTDVGKRRGIGVGAFLLAVATAGALAHVGVRGKGIEVAYDLGRERRINTQLEEERRRLNIEIGMLKDPVRVVSLAREKLNMGPPAPTDIVRLQPGQVLGAEAPEHAPAPRRGDGAAQAAPRSRAARARVVESGGGKTVAEPAAEASPPIPAAVEDEPAPTEREPEATP